MDLTKRAPRLFALSGWASLLLGCGHQIAVLWTYVRHPGALQSNSGPGLEGNLAIGFAVCATALGCVRSLQRRVQTATRIRWGAALTAVHGVLFAGWNATFPALLFWLSLFAFWGLVRAPTAADADPLKVTRSWRRPLGTLGIVLTLLAIASWGLIVAFNLAAPPDT